MTIFQRSQLLVSLGGDVLVKGTGALTRRLGTVARGGEGLKETFTRTGTALALSSDGYYLQAQANEPRVEWLNGQPYLLIEGAGATNILEYANALATSPWTGSNCPATNGQSTDPLRGPNYTKLAPNNTAGVNHFVYQSATITANENLAAEIVCNDIGGYTGFKLLVADSLAGTNGFYVAVDLSTATVSGSGAGGTGTFNGAAVDNLGNGNVRIRLWGAVGNGSTTAYVLVMPYPTGALAASATPYTGNGDYIYAWGAQLERNGSNPYAPTSPIITAGATASRGAEIFTVPLNISPRPLAIYLKAYELGQVFGTGTTNEYWFLGQYASTPPSEFIDIVVASPHYTANHGKPNTSIVASGGSIAPSFGQQIEILTLLFADGSVQIIESLAGAAEIAGTRSAANANGLGPVWGNSPVLYVGNGVSALGVINMKVIDNTNGAIATLAQARAIAV